MKSVKVQALRGQRYTWPLATAVAVLGTSLTFNFYIGLATLAYGILFIGLVRRKERDFHVRAMSTGIFLDLGLVLFLEFTRNAINTASSFTLGPTQYVHIIASTLAVTFYLPMLFTGFKLYRGQSNAWRRPMHLRLGVIAFSLRTIGFLTMFSMFKG